MWVQIKIHQTMQMQKNEVDCTEFCKCKALCETWKDILKNNFWQKWATAIKKKKIVAVFAKFFLLYVYYDFALVLISYRNSFIPKLCRKEELFILHSNFVYSQFSLWNWKHFLNKISSFLVCLTCYADLLL